MMAQTERPDGVSAETPLTRLEGMGCARGFTAWVPLPCLWNCMNAAPMQYERAGRGRERGSNCHGSMPTAHGHQE